MRERWLAAAALAAATSAVLATAGSPPPPAAPTGIELSVDGRGLRRSFSVASVELDLSWLGTEARSDAPGEAFLEVLSLDEAGVPRPFDPSREGPLRFAVPWRLDSSWPGRRARLSFVMRDETHTRFSVSAARREGAPRYRGLVGDGDAFSLLWGRREVAASGYDDWIDLDRDGDLDLLLGGTDHRLRVLENVGGRRFADRGFLASDGEVLRLPRDEGRRSWVSVDGCDGDGDGDSDLLLHFLAGPLQGQVAFYENGSGPADPPGARPPRWLDRGPLLTRAGRPVLGSATCADWDGDSRTDVITAAEDLIVLYRNEGPGPVRSGVLAEGVPLAANGAPIELRRARPETADLDADGDLDLLVGTDDGRVLLFANEGSRSEPVLAAGRMLVHHGYMDARTGVKAADFDGDSRLDLAVGRYWHRTDHGDEPPVFGRLYLGVGDPSELRFEERDAAGGAPHAEGFLPVDALRQNAVRVADWDADGRPDLVVGDTDGWVWLFRNAGRGLFPLFEPGRRLRAGGEPIRVLGEQGEGRRAGYARPEVADWDADGRQDLLVADGRGWLTLFLNRGPQNRPDLAPGVRVEAAGKPIDGTGRGSVLVTDWNGDGLQDVIFGMAGEDISRNYAWPPLNPGNQSRDHGFLFYRNVGTARAPVLAAPQWVRAGPHGGREIALLRPNLGSFVDWDGDGRRDLLACEFEDVVRLFRNTQKVPGRPRFASSPTGEVLLEGEILESISGVFAFDWTGDGDPDLLTGQGHAGSGLRFFEHDYVRDLRQGTLPAVTVVGR